MSGWDGAGAFTRVYDWTDDRDGGIKILASRFDSENDTFAAGIQACLAKNGENSATANLNLGGFRFTNAGNATAATDLARVSQVQGAAYNKADAGGTADALTVSFSPAITAYAEGVIYCAVPASNNATTTPTANFNSIGAKTIVKYGSKALVADDIVAAEPAFFNYNATDDNLNLLNPASAQNFVENAITDVVSDTTPQLGGDLDLNGNNIDFPTTANISDCLDEDNMASDSATALVTQQSAKAYVDTYSRFANAPASTKANTTYTLLSSDRGGIINLSASSSDTSVDADASALGNGFVFHARAIDRTNACFVQDTNGTNNFFGRYAGDWAVNTISLRSPSQLYTFVSDGTNWIVFSFEGAWPKVGAFTYDLSTATGTQSITTVNFTPRFIRFRALIDGDNKWCEGSSDGTTHRCIANNQGGTVADYETVNAAVKINVSGSASQSATVSSLDLNGFTLSWTKTGSPTGTATIHYEAFA